MWGISLIKTETLDTIKNDRDLMKLHCRLQDENTGLMFLNIQSDNNKLKKMLDRETYHKKSKERTIESKNSIIKGLKEENLCLCNQCIENQEDIVKLTDLFGNIQINHIKELFILRKRLKCLKEIVRYRDKVILKLNSAEEMARINDLNIAIYNKLTELKRENYNLKRKYDRLKITLANNLDK